jgi:hypothetical protein
VPPPPSAVVDHGLLRRLSDLLLCSRCLRRGLKTRVRQVISPRHKPRSLCPACRASLGPPGAAAAPVPLSVPRPHG